MQKLKRYKTKLANFRNRAQNVLLAEQYTNICLSYHACRATNPWNCKLAFKFSGRARVDISSIRNGANVHQTGVMLFLTAIKKVLA